MSTGVLRTLIDPYRRPCEANRAAVPHSATSAPSPRNVVTRHALALILCSRARPFVAHRSLRSHDPSRRHRAIASQSRARTMHAASAPSSGEPCAAAHAASQSPSGTGTPGQSSSCSFRHAASHVGNERSAVGRTEASMNTTGFGPGSSGPHASADSKTMNDASARGGIHTRMRSCPATAKAFERRSRATRSSRAFARNDRIRVRAGLDR